MPASTVRSAFAGGSTALDSGLPWATGAPTEHDTVSATARDDDAGAFTATKPSNFNVTLIESLSAGGTCFIVTDNESVNPPILGYVETAAGCPATVALPTTVTAGTTAGGKNVVTQANLTAATGTRPGRK